LPLFWCVSHFPSPQDKSGSLVVFTHCERVTLPDVKLRLLITFYGFDARLQGQGPLVPNGGIMYMENRLKIVSVSCFIPPPPPPPGDEWWISKKDQSQHVRMFDENKNSWRNNVLLLFPLTLSYFLLSYSVFSCVPVWSLVLLSF